MDTEPSKGADLDRRTIHFVAETAEELKAGDTLIVRDVQKSEAGLKVSVVTEKAVRDEAAKIFT